jgi:hypothetical protein
METPGSHQPAVITCQLIVDMLRKAHAWEADSNHRRAVGGRRTQGRRSWPNGGAQGYRLRPASWAATRRTKTGRWRT